MYPKYPTLYKRTSTGKIQVWFMEVHGDSYRSTSGQQDGKKTTTEWTVAKPKNVGRANATTAEQQAIAEVEAEYEKKLARDYHRELGTVDVAMRFKPMLATKWEDRKDKLGVLRVFVQPKLDGIRCILNKDGMWSREGKPILGAPHIHKIMMELYADLFLAEPDLTFDGELYNHDYKDDFNKIVSAVKKQKPTAFDLLESEQLIQYHIYDAPSDTNAVFSNRYKGLFLHWQDHPNLVLTPTHEVLVLTGTQEILVEKVDEWAAQFIEWGYEGAMVRIDGLYENKRSKNLIKWKEMQDAEFTIQDIQEGDGNRSGMAARVVLDLGNGRNFAAGLIGNVAYCTQLLIDRDQHIGKKGTVVFQNYTPDGVPRFPKFKTIRDYE